MNDLINYYDNTDFSEEEWTSSQFRKHFAEVFHKTHPGVGRALPWGIKEQVLLRKCMDDFQHEHLADMITYWHTSNPKPAVASSFANFYSARFRVSYKLKEATSDYTWD